MKISETETLRASHVAPIAQTTAVSSNLSGPASAYGKGATPAAQVEFSEHAQAIAAAAVAVDATPDTRDDLVARLKTQIDNGTYKVSGKDIAEQILRRAQADRVR